MWQGSLIKKIHPVWQPFSGRESHRWSWPWACSPSQGEQAWVQQGACPSPILSSSPSYKVATTASLPHRYPYLPLSQRLQLNQILLANAFVPYSHIHTQVFETTIRVLGGLLSSFYLSGGDQALLEKAVDLGER